LTTIPTLTPALTATPAGCGESIPTYCYPNPVGGNTAHFFMNLCEPGSVEVSVYNVAAERILSHAFTGARGGHTVPLQVGGLAHGVYYYLVQLQGASGLRRSKTTPFAVIRP
jgi:hypothetical protein